MSLQTPIKPIRTNETSKLESNESIAPNIYPIANIKRENIVDMNKVETNRESPSRIYKTTDIQRPEGLAMMYSQHLSPSTSHSSRPFVIVEIR